MPKFGVRPPTRSPLSQIVATILTWLLISPAPVVLAVSPELPLASGSPRLAIRQSLKASLSPANVAFRVGPSPVAPAAASPSPSSAIAKAEGSPPALTNCISLAHPDDDRATEDVKKSVPFEADQWGDISIAQPKIWQYERVNTYLDGLLRDVEGVSLTDLTQLDPTVTSW
jgi:hypothetical protein